MKKRILVLLVLAAAGAAVAYGPIKGRLAERGFRGEVVAAAEKGEFGRIQGIWERYQGDLGEPWTDCAPPKGGLRSDDPSLLAVTRTYATALTIVEPSGLVLTGRPSFRWIAPPGERRYHVTVMSRALGPMLDRETTATELAFPPEAEPLQPGFEYLLTVRDLDNVLSAANVPIKIAWADKAKEVEAALSLLRERLGEGPAFEFFAGNFLNSPRERLRRFPTAAARRFEGLAGRFPNSRLLHEILATIYRDLGVGPFVLREIEALKRIDAGK